MKVLYYVLGIGLLLATLIFADCYNGTTTQQHGIVTAEISTLDIQLGPEREIHITLPRRLRSYEVIIEKWSSWSGLFKTVKVIND